MRSEAVAQQPKSHSHARVAGSSGVQPTHWLFSSAALAGALILCANLFVWPAVAQTAASQTRSCPVTGEAITPPGRTFTYPPFFAFAPSSSTYQPHSGQVNDSKGLLAHYDGSVKEEDRNFLMGGGVIRPLNPAASDAQLTNKRVYLDGLNDKEEYVGYSVAAGLAFLWNPSIGVAPITYPGAYATYPHGINDQHRIVGHYSPTVGSRPRGFILDAAAGSYRSYTVPGLDMATSLLAVNQLGDALGTYTNPGEGTAVQQGYPGDDGSFILTRSNKLVYINTSRVYNAYGQLTTCVPTMVKPLSINSFGEVVGTVSFYAFPTTSFYYYNGVFQLLDPGYGDSGLVTAIDDDGLIYGSAPNPSQGNYGFFTGYGSGLRSKAPWYDGVSAVTLPSGPQAKGDTMYPGQTLLPGQSITSRSGRFTLLYQGDGNVVFSDNDYGVALWTSNTPGTPLGVCIMQTNGQLAIYNRFGNRIFNAPNGGVSGSRLVAQDDGNLVEYAPNGQAPWSTGTYARVLPTGAEASGSTMNPGTILKNGESITSPNGRYTAKFTNGVLTLYKDRNTQLWSSYFTSQTFAEVCIMQSDGNLVLYTPNNTVTFTTHTSKNPGAFLRVQDDGNLVLYAAGAKTALWSTHTVQ